MKKRIKRRNADDTLRKLERLAQQGDFDAYNTAKYWQYCEKAGVFPTFRPCLEEAELLVTLASEETDDLEFLGTVDWIAERVGGGHQRMSQEALAEQMANRLALLYEYVMHDNGFRERNTSWDRTHIIDRIAIEFSYESNETIITPGPDSMLVYARLDFDREGDQGAELPSGEEIWAFNEFSMNPQHHFAVDTPGPLTREEVNFLMQQVGAIVHYHDSGAKSVEYYDNLAQLETDWTEMEGEYLEEEEIEEDDYDGNA